MTEESSSHLNRMAEAESSTVSPSNSGTQTPTHRTLLPSFTGPVTVLLSTSDAVSEETLGLGQPKSTATNHSGPAETVSVLHERKQHSGQSLLSDCADKSSIFEAAYRKETERTSLSKKINDFCFRNLGLCSHPTQPNKSQIPVSKPSHGHGVWSSDFHSMCVKLAVYIGTTEYILGPRLAWHYGGFMFYFVVIFLILISSFPANFLESLVGQYAGKSVVVFLPQLGPLFRGLGYAMLIITGLALVYYAVHVANVLIYAYHAAQALTPWHSCNPDYNSKRCFWEKLQERCNQGSNHTIYYDFQCVPATSYCRQNGFTSSNGTHCFYNNHPNLTSRWMVDRDEQQPLDIAKTNASEISSVGVRYVSARDFHYHYIHGEHECETDRSLPVCQNHRRAFALAYCAVWVLALLPCFNLWIASTFAVAVIVAGPMVIMLVLTRVILFPGAWAGVSNFFFGKANLRQLLTSNFWIDACGMTFWSLAAGMGVIPTLSSRDRLRHGALRSSAILVTADVAFGLLNSILLFSVRGHLELHSGISKEQLRQLDRDSEALVFVAFTTITDGMPRPRFWGSIYFGTMAAQSLATLAMFIVAAALNLVDAVPTFQTRPFWMAVVVAGSPFVLAAVMLVISVLNEVRISLLPLVRLQLVIVELLFVVVVGFKLSKPEFREQVQLQMGMDVRGTWRRLVGCWLIVCPFILLMEIVGQLVKYTAPPVPPGGSAMAILAYTAVTCPLLALIAGALYSARNTPFWELCSTSKEFGARQRSPRRRTVTRFNSSRGRRTSGRRGSVGVARSPTREDSVSRRSSASETSEDIRWEMAKRSTLLNVA